MRYRNIRTGLPFFLLLSLMILPGLPFAAAKKGNKTKGHCGFYYSSPEVLHRSADPYMMFFQFKKGDQVASIGAQCSTTEASYAALADSVTFYLQDIDSTYCNERQVSFAWHYYDTLEGPRPTNSTYHIVTGEEKKTLLPAGHFDKIMIINTFHEFTYPDDMLQDIAAKLKEDGMLYIDEALPKKPGQLHGQCKRKMYTPEELKAVLGRNGFTFDTEWAPPDRSNKKRVQHAVFAFKKKQKG